MRKIITLFLFCIIFSAMPALSGSVPTIDKDELKALLDSDTLVVFDVRTGRDWSSSGEKIKHAIRVDGRDLAVAKTFPKDNTFVLYCA